MSDTDRKIITITVRDEKTGEPIRAASFVADTRPIAGELLLPLEWQGVHLRIHVRVES